MGYTVINIECIDQKLRPTNTPVLASGGVEEDLVIFSFCPLWAELKKTAVFYMDPAEVYHADVLTSAQEGECCTIPAGAMRGPGVLYISVFGEDADGTVVRTAEAIPYPVRQGAFTLATVPAPKPNVYQAMRAQLEELTAGQENLCRKVGEPLDVTLTPKTAVNVDAALSNKTQSGRAASDNITVYGSGVLEFTRANTDYSYCLLTSKDGAATAGSWTKARYTALNDPEAKYRVLLRNTAMTNSAFDAVDYTGFFRLTEATALLPRVEDLETETAALRAQVDGLGAEVAAQQGIAYPDKEAALIEAVTAAAAENTVIFGIVTDTHFDEDRYGMNQPKYAETFMRICSALGADFAAHLGDMTEEGSLTSDAFAYINDRHMGRMMEEYAKTQVPFVYAVGHHEQYPITLTTEEIDGVTVPTNKAAYPVDIIMDRTFDLIKKNGNKIASSTVVKHNGSGSYYFDITKGGTVRFLVVDSTSWGANGFSPAVVAFASTALEDAAEREWPVVIFAHNAANCYAVPISASENPAGYIAAGKWGINNGEALEEAIRSSGANVLAYIHGHTHRDNIAQLQEVTPGADGYSIAALGEYINAFPYVSVCCQRVVNQGACHPEYVQGAPAAYARQRNTYSEYCFDIALLHTDTGAFELYRFGAGDSGEYPTRIIH